MVIITLISRQRADIQMSEQDFEKAFSHIRTCVQNSICLDWSKNHTCVKRKEDGGPGVSASSSISVVLVVLATQLLAQKIPSYLTSA